MESVKKGQTVRVVIDGKPRKFVVAEVLFDADDRSEQVGQGRPPRDATRWNELLICRTARGALAIRTSWVTCWQGESDRFSWVVKPDESGAADLLASVLDDDDSFGITPPPGLARDALTALGWFDLVAEEV